MIGEACRVDFDARLLEGIAPFLPHHLTSDVNLWVQVLDSVGHREKRGR